jgi:hypothetical protein
VPPAKVIMDLLEELIFYLKGQFDIITSESEAA